MKNILVTDHYKTDSKQDFYNLEKALSNFQLFRSPLRHVIKDLLTGDYEMIVFLNFHNFSSELPNLIQQIKSVSLIPILLIGSEEGNIVEDFGVFECVDKNFKKIARIVNCKVDYEENSKIYIANSRYNDTLLDENKRLTSLVSELTGYFSDLLKLIK